MTTIKDIRRVYTGGHVGSCGPIEGETVTEITFERGDGTEYFVSGTTFQEYYNVYVSNESLYEKLVAVVECPVAETEERTKVINSIAAEMHSGEVNEYEELERSKYRKEFQMVLTHCYEDWDNLTLSKFDESCLGKKLEEIETDFPRDEDDDEDWDEDDDEEEEPEPNPLPDVEIRSIHCDVCKNDWIGGISAEAVIQEDDEIKYIEVSEDYESEGNYQCEVNKHSVHKLMTFEEDGDINPLREDGELYEDYREALATKYGMIFKILVETIRKMK